LMVAWIPHAPTSLLSLRVQDFDGCRLHYFSVLASVCVSSYLGKRVLSIPNHQVSGLGLIPAKLHYGIFHGFVVRFLSASNLALEPLTTLAKEASTYCHVACPSTPPLTW